MTPENEFLFLDDLKDMFFLTNEKGDIFRSNKRAMTVFGSVLKNGTGNFLSLVDNDYHEKFSSALDFAIHSGKRQDIFVKVPLASSSKEMELSIVPINNSSVGSILIQAHDVTEERRRELDLLKFYYVAENTVNPLQITDLDGNMVYVNPAFVQTSGFKREELIGKSPKIFGSGKHSKRFWAKMWETINSGKVWVGEVENKKKNGEPFYTQLLISPILNQEGKVNGFFGIHRDLSEKRLLEKQLIHTQKMESIGTLAAGIAHEVGNPLASISALVQVAQRSTDDVFINEKLGLVKSQVTRISKIIRDLVDFSRPSNYELQLIDLNANIKEAVEITRVGTKAKNVQFEMDLNEKIPHLPLIADQVQQVFVNILLNAVDAINEIQDPKRINRIRVRSEIKDDHVYVTFTDTGKGIPEEHFTKVFEPFFTTKKEGKGTGLGLWVSYGIVKSFQGDIKVSSVINEGTTFVISLPIQA